MVTLGVLMPAEAPGRGAVYRIAPHLRGARAFRQQRLRPLREYLERQDVLRNADYRELFGVTRTAATQELRKLVEDRFLVREGERRRARYRAGPALRALRDAGGR